MIKEYEGKNEQDAIEKAMADLNLTADQIEVEILEVENKKGFFFKKQNVKIRVHYNENNLKKSSGTGDKAKAEAIPLSKDYEEASVVFLEKMITLMGYDCHIDVLNYNDNKLTLDIKSDNASILIGKKGKNLDALQLLVNVYLSKISQGEITTRVVVDTEDYRRRREETIVRSAKKNADQVSRSKRSRLLEPMNPFERRLVHTALNDRNDVITQSEGDGLYKQIRIIYKGSR